ncbi:unnamed protein product [Effrenium voratum]|uniref:Flavin-containing monooxygenase n=1 Tax=Effrenium voratum TaxID=2562239 RepID=A0AA36MV09_9DINO|nr:unnamed protein product [Effrenium voratum]CAJ1429781.1 unnamed protein product [Effrenium voratum]
MAPVGGVRSTTARSCAVQIFGSEEELVVPVTVSTRTLVVKELISQKTGVHVDDLKIMAKGGPFMRELRNTDEVRSQCWVKGVESFKRKRQPYAHPHAIIGAGHNGLRQALVFAENKDTNYVLFDRHDRVGGTSWLDHANKWSKVQTELGTYHLNYSEQCECPKGISPWPSRDELLAHFDQVCDEWGLRPHFKMSTDVQRYEVRSGEGGQSYRLSLRTSENGKNEDWETTVASLVMYPGNLTIPRREEYKGEDVFGGVVSYGMFDETDYGALTGKNVAIVGFGAFAVENIRTCCEHRSGKIYLVCRRKNLCMPRMVSWWINGSVFPVAAGDVLREMEDAYKMVGDDPWSYYAVRANESRSNVTIFQKARFGIGDIYFLSRYYGKSEVVIGTVKKLSESTMHLEDGRKLQDVQAILKLFGFVPDWAVDKFLQLKHLTGIWVNDDYRLGTMSEFPTVNAQRFGGTSLSPGAVSWCNMFYYFWGYPKDFEKMLASGMLVKHFPNMQKDEPGYVMDAQHGSQVLITIGGLCPQLAETMSRYDDRFKRSKQWGTHTLTQIQAIAEEDWFRYCKMFKDAGDDRPFPAYPYSKQRVHAMVDRQDREEHERLAKKGLLQA